MSMKEKVHIIREIEMNNHKTYDDGWREKFLIEKISQHSDILESLEKNKLDWKQLLQIAIAVEHDVTTDMIEIFAQPRFDWLQMMEMREGCESNISKEQLIAIATSNLDAWDMKDMRFAFIKKNWEDTYFLSFFEKNAEREFLEIKKQFDVISNRVLFNFGAKNLSNVIELAFNHNVDIDMLENLDDEEIEKLYKNHVCDNQSLNVQEMDNDYDMEI